MFESKGSSDDKSINEGLVKYTETIAKNVNKLTEKFDRLTENVDGLVSHNDYIIENLEKVKNYAELIGEKSNIGINYSEKLAESVDFLIDYTKMVAEKTDQGIEYTKLVAEKADQGIEYTKHVAEKSDKGIEYTQKLAESTDFLIEYNKMLAEKTNSLINHVDYVAEETSNRWKYQSHINEQLDNVISHNDYIVEGTDSFIQYSNFLKEQTENLSSYVDFIVKQINEGASVEEITKNASALISTVDKTKEITKNIITESEETFKEDLNNQLAAILESAKEEKNQPTEYHFFNFLGESKRKEFESFNVETKTKIVNAFNRNRYYGTADANAIWESCFAPETKTINWLTSMPNRFINSWNALSESQQNSIKAQASTKLLESQYQIDNFWATRDLREVKVEALNEGANNAPINNNDPSYETPNAYMDSVRAGFRSRFKR
jgi:hypothetical protein